MGQCNYLFCATHTHIHTRVSRGHINRAGTLISAGAFWGRILTC